MPSLLPAAFCIAPNTKIYLGRAKEYLIAPVFFTLSHKMSHCADLKGRDTNILAPAA
jgi:hypothetical protein